MNSQSPYTMQPRTPMAYSNILSDNGSNNGSSGYPAMRNDKEFMHSSGINMKHSAIYSNQYQKPYHQPNSYGVNSQQKFMKPSSVHFMPSSNMLKQKETPNIPPNYNNPNIPRQIILEKQIYEIKEKLGILFSYMNQKESISNQKKETDSEASFFKNSQKLTNQDSIIQQTMHKDSVKLQNSPDFNKITEFIETQKQENRKLRQCLDKIQLMQKRMKEDIEQMRQKGYSSSVDHIELGQNDQVMIRIRNIEKSIREMGQDIHLINDKEQGLAEKISVEIADLRKTIRNNQKPPINFQKLLSVQEKTIMDQQKNYTELKQAIMAQSLQIQKIQSKIVKLTESDQLSKLKKKLDQLSIKLNEEITKISQQKSFNGIKSTIKSFQAPIMLKYLSKFQVTQNNGQCIEINLENLTYYIDKQGYLLDNDRFYLLRSGTNQRIRLQEKHLQMLRRNKLLI